MVDVDGWPDPNNPDESQPVPGLAHGAIPGLLGVMLSGGKSGGIGSDYNAYFSGARRPHGMGSDYVASGGAGLPADSASPDVPPQRREGIGSYIRNQLGLPNLVRPDVPPGRGGIGSDYAAGGPPMPPNPEPLPPNQAPPSGAPPAAPQGNGQPLQAPLFMRSGVAYPPSAQPQPVPPAGGELPPNAAPAMGDAPPPDNSPISKDSLLGKLFSHLGDFRDKNKMTLLAMAGGLAGAPSLGTGLGRAFQAAGPAQRLDVAQNNMNMTAKALIAKGLPPDIANAAATNPDMLKQLLPQLFGAKQFQHVTAKGPLGEDIPLVFDPAVGKYRHADGTPYGESGGTGGAGGASVQLLAPGVKYDPTLTGDAHVDQFSPEVKAAIKSYIAGDTMPSGNPRMKSIADFAKTQAQRWGAETGNPVSDALYSQRRTYRQQLGSNSPNSAGGQAKSFNQGISHMSELAETLQALKNKDPIGVPKVAEYANRARQWFDTEQAAVADKARSIGQTVAGEVGKLFSGSAGGGVHERELTRDRFDTVKSPKQLAAALEATLAMMHGGLTALESRRDEVLGPGNDVNFTSKETKANITKIEDIISQLKGKTQPKTEGGAAPGAAPKEADLVRQNGHVYQRQPDGSYKAIQ